MKLGENLTNPVALIDQLYDNGVAAVVLFNRFYQPDIDIKNVSYVPGEVFSNPSDVYMPLRWIAISSSIVDKIDYAASGGVHSAEALIKVLLAGASAAEICSVVYQKSPTCIKEMLDYLEFWMKEQGYDKISLFKGKLNAKDIKGLNMWERTQFLKYFSSRE